MAPYHYSGPIDCTGPVNCDLSGKTAVVTGGASGIGEAYTLALLRAGCTVIVGDINPSAGQSLTSSFPNQVKIVKCNVASWSDQQNLFHSAAAFSPTGKIHYVVANAGIIRPDSVFKYEADEPAEPELSTIDVNIKGTLYTAKQAMHYFIKQNGTIPSDTQEDTCLVLIGSGAGIHDCLRQPQYSASKWAMRGMLHSLRRTTHFYGSRVNVIHPWYVKTAILSEEEFASIEAKGVELALAEDAGQCLLRIVGDSSINGHSFFIAARRWAKNGYMDTELEDTEESELRKEIQVDQLIGAPAEAGLFL